MCPPGLSIYRCHPELFLFPDFSSSRFYRLPFYVFPASFSGGIPPVPSLAEMRTVKNKADGDTSRSSQLQRWAGILAINATTQQLPCFDAGRRRSSIPARRMRRRLRQRGRHWVGWGIPYWTTGNNRLKVAPIPGSLSAQINPLWFSTTF